MKNKKFLFLLCIVILILGVFIFINLNAKKNAGNRSVQTSTTQIEDKTDSSKLTENTSETEVSYSYEKVNLSVEELKKYREDIELAGFDSTLFTDQEIQTMALELSKNGQSISDYLKNQPDKQIDEAEIEKARNELKAANIDVNKMHNNEIVDIVKKAKEEKKSVVEVAKEK